MSGIDLCRSWEQRLEASSLEDLRKWLKEPDHYQARLQELVQRRWVQSHSEMALKVLFALPQEAIASPQFLKVWKTLKKEKRIKKGSQGNLDLFRQACRSGASPLSSWILLQKLSLKDRDGEKRNLLHLAAMSSDLAILEEAVAHIHQSCKSGLEHFRKEKSRSGNTALDIAFQLSQSQNIDCLIANQVPLSDLRQVKKLMLHGAGRYLKMAREQFPHYFAAYFPLVAQEALQKDWAAWVVHLEEAKVDLSALLYGEGIRGESLLHLAVKYRSDKVIESLLELGASPWVKNEAGQLPMELCALDQKKALLHLTAAAIEWDANKGIHHCLLAFQQSSQSQPFWVQLMCASLDEQYAAELGEHWQEAGRELQWNPKELGEKPEWRLVPHEKKGFVLHIRDHLRERVVSVPLLAPPQEVIQKVEEHIFREVTVVQAALELESADYQQRDVSQVQEEVVRTLEKWGKPYRGMICPDLKNLSFWLFYFDPEKRKVLAQPLKREQEGDLEKACRNLGRPFFEKIARVKEEVKELFGEKALVERGEELRESGALFGVEVVEKLACLKVYLKGGAGMQTHFTQGLSMVQLKAILEERKLGKSVNFCPSQLSRRLETPVCAALPSGAESVGLFSLLDFFDQEEWSFRELWAEEGMVQIPTSPARLRGGLERLVKGVEGEELSAISRGEQLYARLKKELQEIIFWMGSVNERDQGEVESRRSFLLDLCRSGEKCGPRQGGEISRIHALIFGGAHCDSLEDQFRAWLDGRKLIALDSLVMEYSKIRGGEAFSRRHNSHVRFALLRILEKKKVKFPDHGGGDYRDQYEDLGGKHLDGSVMKNFLSLFKGGKLLKYFWECVQEQIESSPQRESDYVDLMRGILQEEQGVQKELEVLTKGTIEEKKALEREVVQLEGQLKKEEKALKQEEEELVNEWLELKKQWEQCREQVKAMARLHRMPQGVLKEKKSLKERLKKERWPKPVYRVARLRRKRLQKQKAANEKGREAHEKRCAALQEELEKREWVLCTSSQPQGQMTSKGLKEICLYLGYMTPA